ncbi:hypothetical protein Hdeb2414_s0016g00484111 [Helianthus debilis subsp. tardiflorus]
MLRKSVFFMPLRRLLQVLFASRDDNRTLHDNWSLLLIEVLYDPARVHNWSTCILMEGSLVETHSILKAGSYCHLEGGFRVGNYGPVIQLDL